MILSYIWVLYGKNISIKKFLATCTFEKRFSGTEPSNTRWSMVWRLEPARVFTGAGIIVRATVLFCSKNCKVKKRLATINNEVIKNIWPKYLCRYRLKKHGTDMEQKCRLHPPPHALHWLRSFVILDQALFKPPRVLNSPVAILEQILLQYYMTYTCFIRVMYVPTTFIST